MKLKSIFRGDKGIWVVFFLLSLISLVAVYSSIGLEAYMHASAGKTPGGLFRKHLFIVALTYVAIIFISRINYRYFSRFALLGYFASLVLLVVVFVVGGRWLQFNGLAGINQFQPSEIAKVVLIIFVARQLTLKQNKVDSKEMFWQMLIFIGLVAGFILPQNLSTAALTFLACYIMMYLGGVNRKRWWLLLAAGIVVGGIWMGTTYANYERSQKDGGQVNVSLVEREQTWGHRLHSWINPNDSILTQDNIARMAIARGGLLGKHVGNTIHGRLMTEAHNDFIFAVIIEETGAIGGMIVFTLYAIFFLRCVRLARRCDGMFGKLTVAGIGIVIYLQALINMSVAVGALPVTGQTLPFISFGGTAYLFLGCGVGVIQAVAVDVQQKEKAVAEKTTPKVEPENSLATP